MRLAWVAVVLATGAGCSTVRYLAQAASGQFELLHEARPLAVAQADSTQPAHVRRLLSKVAAIKHYGESRGLTATRNYKTYADLHRRAAVWVVQGAPRLSLQPRRWDFPIVGSVPYLGFFDEASAREWAKRLEAEEDIDVTVRTAAAYSTLGWFRDPVLSTMLPDAPDAFGDLANTILHESVHATVYVPSQSSFNESLASFVADGLTWELLVGRGGLEDAETKAWLEGEARSEQFSRAFHETWETLDALYRSPLVEAEKRAKKAEIFEGLKVRFKLKRALNNADLAGSRTYATGRDAFERLRRACGSWRGLLDAVRSLRPEDFEHPQQAEYDAVIDALAKRACAK